jgi:hypothetical protein
MMVEEQIEVLSFELERISATDAGCTRIRKIPGIGPIVATAIVAAIGNGAAFRKGRDFAAWLGLVPRQHSTGGKAKLLGISKHAATFTCARFSSTVHELLCCGSSGIGRRLEPGWTHSTPELPKTSSWSPWPTSWHASPGLCCRPEKTTTPEPSLPQPKAVRKDACGLEALTRFHFTALRQRLEIYPPRSAQEEQGRKNSHNGVSPTCNENGLEKATDRLRRADTRATH